MKRLILAALVLALAAPAAAAAPGDGCNTKRCRDHVRIEVRAKWRAEAWPYRDWLFTTRS